MRADRLAYQPSTVEGFVFKPRRRSRGDATPISARKRGPSGRQAGKNVRVLSTLASRDVATRAGPASGETKCSAAAGFAPERAVAVSGLAGDPSPSLSTARDRRRHRLVARRRSRRPPADETNNPTPDPRLTRGMSKLVTRAASRALGTAPTRGRHLAPIPASHHRVRPVPRGPPRRRRNATDVASTSSSSWHPRRAFRRVADPRGTAVPAPTTRSLLFPARTRPARSPPDETAREPADPSALTVPELKALLRARGQRVGGRKAELVDRVLATGGGIPIARAPTPRPPTPHLTSRRSRRTCRRVCRVRRPRLLRDRRGLVRQNARLACAGRSPTRLHRLEVPPPRRGRARASRAVLERERRARVAGEGSRYSRSDRRGRMADAAVLQETKLQAKMVPEMDARVLEKYPHRVWNCATSRLGYSGVAMFCGRSTPATSAWSDPFVVGRVEGRGTGRRLRGSIARSSWARTCPTRGTGSNDWTRA